MPSINTGDIDLSNLANFSGYKANTTYNVQQESPVKYYVIGIVVLWFLFFKKK